MFTTSDKTFVGGCFARLLHKENNLLKSYWSMLQSYISYQSILVKFLWISEFEEALFFSQWARLFSQSWWVIWDWLQRRCWRKSENTNRGNPRVSLMIMALHSLTKPMGRVLDPLFTFAEKLSHQVCVNCMFTLFSLTNTCTAEHCLQTLRFPIWPLHPRLRGSWETFSATEQFVA